MIGLYDRLRIQCHTRLCEIAYFTPNYIGFTTKCLVPNRWSYYSSLNNLA